MSAAGAILLTCCYVVLYLFLSLPAADAFVAVAVEGWGRGRLIRSLDSGVTWTALIECYIDLQAVATPSPYSVVAVGTNGTIITAPLNVTALPASLLPNSSVLLPSSLSLPAYSSSYPGSYLSLLSTYIGLSLSANLSLPNSSLSSYYSSLYPPPFSTAWTPTSKAYVFSTVTPTTTATFTSLVFLTPLLGITVGTSGAIYRSVDGGLTFASVPSPLTLDLTGLTFRQSGGGWLVLACGSVGAVVTSADAGLTWTVQNASSTRNLYAAAMWDASHAAACGDGGTLLTSSTGGVTWTTLTPSAYANYSFHSIAYLSASSLYIAGTRSLLLRTDDGGLTFQAQPIASSPYTQRLSSLFFTPSLLAMAGRSQLYTALPSASSASPPLWSAGSLINVNSIAAIALMEAAVVTVALPVFNLSTFCGLDLTFNVSITNTGTDVLNITAVTSLDLLIALLLPPSPLLSPFPITLLPSSPPFLLNFSYSSSLLPSATATYYTNLTLHSDAPVQRTVVHFSVYTVPLPSSSSSSFLSQYWYVVALIAAAVVVLLFVFVRRRMKYIARWNRRVLYEDEKIAFWGCWLLSKEIDHDSDSEFWSEEDEEGEEEDGDQDWDGTGGSEGGGTWDASGDRSWTASKEGVEAKQALGRQRITRARESVSAAGDGEEDDGEWDDEDGDGEADPANELGDDEGTDSSISDQDYTDGDWLRKATTHGPSHGRHIGPAITVPGGERLTHRRNRGSVSNSRRSDE